MKETQAETSSETGFMIPLVDNEVLEVVGWLTSGPVSKRTQPQISLYFSNWNWKTIFYVKFWLFSNLKKLYWIMLTTFCLVVKENLL